MDPAGRPTAHVQKGGDNHRRGKPVRLAHPFVVGDIVCVTKVSILGREL
jgi:hypothetical protein